MKKIKTLFSTTWVFFAAAIIIIGSGSAMAFALNNNIPESTSSSVTATKEDKQIEPSKADTKAEYTVENVFTGEESAEQKALIIKKLEKTEKISPEQIDKRYNEILANLTPGPKDMSIEEAAAYGADYIKKIYGVDLTGYKAQGSFSKNPLPNSDNWGFIFHAPNEDDNTRRYSVSVDSVTGTMLNIGFYTFNYTEPNNQDLRNPEWKNKAVEQINKFVPENTTIASSKVISATKLGGVTVVCELSDGSAYAACLTGENKDIIAIIYFPNGYDGSLDYHAPTPNAVG